MARNSAHHILNHTPKESGFTLQEIMIVVAILGVLSAVAIPKFGSMLRNAREGDVKSKLGILRSALNVYFAENLANFPQGATGNDSTLLSLSLTPKYIKTFPPCYVYPHHNTLATTDNTPTNDFVTADPTDDGEWVYVSVKSNTNWGLVGIECYHSDLKNRKWSSY